MSPTPRHVRQEIVLSLRGTQLPAMIMCCVWGLAALQMMSQSKIHLLGTCIGAFKPRAADNAFVHHAGPGFLLTISVHTVYRRWQPLQSGSMCSCRLRTRSSSQRCALVCCRAKQRSTELLQVNPDACMSHVWLLVVQGMPTSAEGSPYTSVHAQCTLQTEA